MRLLLAAMLLLFPGYAIHKQETHYTQYDALHSQYQPNSFLWARNSDVSRFAIQTPQAQSEKSNSYDASQDCLYRIYLLATIVGVFGAWAGIYVLYRQTTATEKSAGAANDAAIAASNNAKALMNAERPWLVPKIVRTIEQVPNMRQADGGQTYRNVTYFSFWIRNVGRTPAQVVAVRGDPRFIYDGIDGGFTDPPDYGLPVVFKHIRLLRRNSVSRHL